MMGPDKLERIGTKRIVTKLLHCHDDLKRPRHVIVSRAEKIAEEEGAFLNELKEQMRIFGSGDQRAAGIVSQQD